MVAVMVENDSTMEQYAQHDISHSDFVFFFFENFDRDNSSLNKPTRKLHKSINGGVLSFRMLYDSIRGWLNSIGMKECKGSICTEDALIGYLQHVMCLNAKDIAMIVHQFHINKAINRISSKCLPESVWLKILSSRKESSKEGSMGLGRHFYFED